MYKLLKLAHSSALQSISKKFLTVFILLAVVANFFFFPEVALAQSRWWAPTVQEFNDKVNNPSTPQNEIFGERYTQAQVYWIIYSVINFFMDERAKACAAAYTNANELVSCIGGPTADAGTPQYASSYTPGGILAVASLSDFMLSHRPASGFTYVASKLQDLGVSTAYAQESGFGFNTLGPILGLWTASRNAAYALMTLAVIILAFMVMFRTKISPQASVTVQSAIPRVIIGLLLITFSYAIAGFVIDMSYVVLGVIAAVLSGSGLMTNPSALNAVQIFNVMNDAGGLLVGMGLAIFFLLLVPVLLAGAGGVVLGVGLGPAGAAVAVASLVIAVIIIIVLVVAIVRIFWLLLKSYAMIILLVIALPFGALGYVASTGSNPFMQILRSLVAQMSVFVSVLLVIMFGHLIFWGFGAAQPLNQTFMNGFNVRVFYDSGLAGFGFPGFSGANPSLLGVFLGLFILLMAPSIANGIREWISTGRYVGGPGMGPTLMPIAFAGRLGGPVAGQDFVTQFEKRKAAAGGVVTTRLRGEQMIATGLRTLFKQIK